MQASLDRRAESKVVSLDLSSDFDLVNHKVLLFKLTSKTNRYWWPLTFGNDDAVLRSFMQSFYHVLSTAHQFGALDPIVI